MSDNQPTPSPSEIPTVDLDTSVERASQDARMVSRRRQRDYVRSEEMTVTVRTLIRALLPVLLVFGIYIISYGPHTPGGGFQGGMIIVGVVMVYYLAYGYKTVRRFQEEDLDLLEHLGSLGYLLLGLLGIVFGGTFLVNFMRGGQPGTLLSAGIVSVLNMLVGIKVTAGTLVVLLILLKSLQKGD